MCGSDYVTLAKTCLSFIYKSGPGRSKLTMSFVNVSLKFQTTVSENTPLFSVEKRVRSFCTAKASLIFFQQKEINVFGYK